MIGDIFPTPNPYLILLSSIYVRWQQAIAALEDATRRLDPNAASVASDAGYEAARQANQLTQGNVDQAIEQRWIAALNAWNNAGFGLPSSDRPSTPTWVWVLVGVLGLAVIRQHRGR